MAVKLLFRAGFFAALVLAGQAPAAAQSEFELSPATRVALGVETAPIANAGAIESVSAPAIIIAPNGALQAAASPFDGVLVNALATPGGAVKAGDPLAIIYSAAYADGAAELEARRLTMAHMDHLASKADELFKLGLRSEQEADEAHHDAMSARLAFEALNTQLEYVNRGAQPGQFILTAPAAGTVTHIYPGAGETISAGAPVMSIFTGETYWARAQLSERNAAFLKPGAPVGIDNFSERGEIVSVDPEINPQTRSLDVLVALPRANSWRLGAMLSLAFETTQMEGALSAPIKAIVRIGGADVVFVETQTGFRITPVEIVSRSRQDAIIRGDIEAGERLAISGLAALKNIASGV